jgi:hypothetical protein
MALLAQLGHYGKERIAQPVRAQPHGRKLTTCSLLNQEAANALRRLMRWFLEFWTYSDLSPTCRIAVSMPATRAAIGTDQHGA